MPDEQTEEQRPVKQVESDLDVEVGSDLLFLDGTLEERFALGAPREDEVTPEGF